MDYRKYPARKLRHWLSAPIIYFMIVPLALFDLCLEIYHQTCFRLYKIPIVRRSSYIKFDRYKLQYLGWWDKIDCTYCSYANGLMHYASMIAGETEKYWCGIKHKSDPEFIPQAHQKDFLEYGDEEALKKLSK